MSESKSFHVHAPATEKARRPIVSDGKKKHTIGGRGSKYLSRLVSAVRVNCRRYSTTAVSISNQHAAMQRPMSAWRLATLKSHAAYAYRVQVHNRLDDHSFASFLLSVLAKAFVNRSSCEDTDNY